MRSSIFLRTRCSISFPSSIQDATSSFLRCSYRPLCISHGLPPVEWRRRGNGRQLWRFRFLFRQFAIRIKFGLGRNKRLIDSNQKNPSQDRPRGPSNSSMGLLLPNGRHHAASQHQIPDHAQTPYLFPDVRIPDLCRCRRHGHLAHHLRREILRFMVRPASHHWSGSSRLRNHPTHQRLDPPSHIP